jgi:AhpC/TSA antioxidant enzyme
MWCGSHVRLRRLTESTQCSFPIYADPNGRVYQLLEKTCAGTGVDSNRASVQASSSSYSPTAALTNLVQSARRIGDVNPLKSGDTRHHIGAAFLFESNETVRITWSYRIANDSARAEADVIRRVLGVGSAREEKQARSSKTSTKSSGGMDGEKLLKSDNEDEQGSFGCIYGLPKARHSHRRTVSCTENFQWRPRIFCLPN